jgi:hypothetical protein
MVTSSSKKKGEAPTKFRLIGWTLAILCTVLSLFNFSGDLKAYTYTDGTTAVAAEPHIVDEDSIATKTEAPKSVAVDGKPHLDDNSLPADNNKSSATVSKKTLAPKSAAVQHQKNKTMAPKAVIIQHPKNKQWDPETVRLAQEFVESRRQVYIGKEMLKTWKMRGVGWALTKKNIILAAQPLHNPKLGQNVIQVFNVLQNTTTVGCDKYDIWVRVYGPEIFAASARAVFPEDPSQSCHWELPFDLQKPGTYTVEAKLLYHNALEENVCANYKGLPENISYPIHAGFVGFKFYNSDLSCCEACTRLAPDCRYWSTPPQNFTATFARNGCELYFDDQSNPDAIPESHLIDQGQRRRLGGVPKKHGPPDMSTPSPYHVGCGWDSWLTLDFSCLSGALDDAVFVKETNFTVAIEPTAKDIKPVVQKELPICTLDHERSDQHSGRWVLEAWPDTKMCPRLFGYDPLHAKMFQIAGFDPAHPHCWHRDDFSDIGRNCAEMNCRFISPESKWRSPHHEEKKFFGYWKNYDCDYMEFTNEQLQQCVDTKKIGEFKTAGASISLYLNQYLMQRMDGIKLYNGTNAITITLDTLSLLHAFGPGFPKKMKARPMVGKLEEHYWVTGFYLSSEREPGDRGPIMQRDSRIAYDILQPKGYKMLDLYDLSAAFTYDTATQSDGMHIIGPPMKMAITKLLHHLCVDAVQGSRLG